jgi:hypothetical protein
MHPNQGKQIGEVKGYRSDGAEKLFVMAVPQAAHNHPSSCRRGRLISSFDVKGFCRDKPLVVEEVIREVVEILYRIDSNPHFDKSLRRGCEIDKQDLFEARCASIFWRRGGSKDRFVVLRGH